MCAYAGMCVFRSFGLHGTSVCVCVCVSQSVCVSECVCIQ